VERTAEDLLALDDALTKLAAEDPAAEDFVRGRLGAAGVRPLEEAFCRWLAEPTAEAGLYGLRNRVAHLLEVGCATEAAALLQDWRWLEAKVGAGLVFELAGDFTAVSRALPQGEERRLLGLLEEALRRDIHFIHRHHQDFPQALFQCLGNSAWWYDCPQAARVSLCRDLVVRQRLVSGRFGQRRPVPELDRAVLASGGQAPAIGAEGDPEHGTFGARQRPDFLSRRHVPDFHLTRHLKPR
jgi:hypothetical protein